MTSQNTAIEHLSRRLVISLPATYETAREHYEALVPEADTARYYQLTDWQEVLDAMKVNAPHGFVRYMSSDITGVMVPSGSSWNATQYLMGNHTIAARMFRHDPSMMLYAPLRTLLYSDAAGDTKFVVDQPSLLFGSFGNPEITAVGEELDGLLATLIELLGGQAPGELRPSVAAFTKS
ncbi:MULTISPECIES: DUF302 domain-containing protein [unclassified Mycolicibacterium]|uniref:DUF302 domain-containing protein n=1 Tax=unclassified Mycolicibacterium TaxID=2636767 RepID=UPI002814E3E8|nr:MULTISPECIES: DUF302 domain-containing protein [unclassified Mycolicibacterium]